MKSYNIFEHIKLIKKIKPKLSKAMYSLFVMGHIYMILGTLFMIFWCAVLAIDFVIFNEILLISMAYISMGISLACIGTLGMLIPLLDLRFKEMDQLKAVLVEKKMIDPCIELSKPGPE